MNWFQRTQIGLQSLLLVGCTGLPKNIQPVNDFDINQYFGRWYEIARLDHRFEKNLTSVTADYRKTSATEIEVTNRGYNQITKEWTEATGVAKFVQDSQVAHLKVAFMVPFYASYVIFDLDKHYQYAIVTGYNRDYLWLLSRTPTVSEAVYQHFLQQADIRGFEIDKLIRVSQSHHQNKDT
jgi:apolipoprotein D and lipocalin family protein